MLILISKKISLDAIIMLKTKPMFVLNFKSKEHEFSNQPLVGM